ncbi:hypothetical protein CEXT_280851 [Caerostris extrusa]|uniref:Cytochrome P450 n=1 Tax=Caerostris extrusa TaxID=172846 RepID=A0AAV4PHH6_CAEEX|nr:hypothetical protein CEXT_280851 [Caerostris extrusa]
MQQNGGKTPPGPVGLPFLGYLPFLEPNPHLVLQRLAKDYGPIFSFEVMKQERTWIFKNILHELIYTIPQQKNDDLQLKDVQEKTHKEARLNRLLTRLSDTNLLHGAFSSKERRYLLCCTEATIAQLLRRSNSIPLMFLGVSVTLTLSNCITEPAKTIGMLAMANGSKWQMIKDLIRHTLYVILKETRKIPTFTLSYNLH